MEEQQLKHASFSICDNNDYVKKEAEDTKLLEQ